MHSLIQLEPGNAEQVHNSWRSHSGETTTRNHLRPVSVHWDDAETVSLGFTHDMILPPSPRPSTQPIMQSPMPEIVETETLSDPRIASLKAIFPDFDDAVILSVLESAGHDHDRALDVLLGMNDPSFVLPTSPPRPMQPPSHQTQFPSGDAQRFSQEELDEQFARRLALEEEERVAAQERALQNMPSYIMYQPYQTRRGGRSGWNGRPRMQSQTQTQTQIPSQTQTQTQGQGGKDTVSEFQEGFSRIAESGKKTFSSLMSKVRAKMQEFEHGQGWSGSQGHPSDQSAQPFSASSPGQLQDSAQHAYTEPAVNRQSYPARTSTPPRSGVLRPAAIEPTLSQPSYYDPNTRGYDLYGDDEEVIEIVDRRTPSVSTATAPPTAPIPALAPVPAAVAPIAAPLPSSVTAAPPRTESPSTPPPPSESSSPPSYTSPVLSPSNSTKSPSISLNLPSRSFSPTSGVKAAGTTTGAQGSVDFSKLGLLPKRPISLVGVTAATGTGGDTTKAGQRVSINSERTLVSPVDREESEFVENPFEDQS